MPALISQFSREGFAHYVDTKDGGEIRFYYKLGPYASGKWKYFLAKTPGASAYKEAEVTALEMECLLRELTTLNPER